MVVLYVILAVLVLLIAVVLLRTAAFRPKAEAAKTYAPVEFDREAPSATSMPPRRTRRNSKSSSPCCRNYIPMFMKNAPSPACRTAACCSTGRARPTMRLRS